jgi:hypothetical protein
MVPAWLVIISTTVAYCARFTAAATTIIITTTTTTTTTTTHACLLLLHLCTPLQSAHATSHLVACRQNRGSDASLQGGLAPAVERNNGCVQHCYGYSAAMMKVGILLLRDRRCEQQLLYSQLFEIIFSRHSCTTSDHVRSFVCVRGKTTLERYTIN